MIDVIKNTPYVLGNKSRDYQALARIQNAAYNYPKMCIDTMEHLTDPNLVDESLLELMCLTVGFEAKHHYSSDALRGVASTFKSLIRRKGTISAIQDAVTMLLRSHNLKNSCYVTEDSYKEESGEIVRSINIFIYYDKSFSTYANDIPVIDDLMEYLLPVGYTYSIYNSGAWLETFSDMIVVEDSKHSSKLEPDVNIDKMRMYSEDITKVKPEINSDTIVNGMKLKD